MQDPLDDSPRRIERFKRMVLRKRRQFTRLMRQSARHGVYLSGAVAVAAFSLLFAWLADEALEAGHRLIAHGLWIPLVMLPPGLAGLRWLTLRFAAQARGSGIPQVIAGLSLPAFDPAQTLLVSLPQALWKIVLTTAALFLGASVGREGPSVQIGAAVMLMWGYWWHRRLGKVRGLNAHALMTTGAAGGLAAAFNTPLAGVVFAIEELTKGTNVRWDRRVISGVLVAGFLALSIVGNNPYFKVAADIAFRGRDWAVVLGCALVCGMAGGLFAKLLLAGPTRLMPARWRDWPQRHPIGSAFGCGVLLSLIGLVTLGATFGTGYDQASALLNGQPVSSPVFGIAKFAATVISYFAGIPGGIFTPALAIGAGIGEHLARITDGIADPRMMALISMAAFLAGATQAPITAAVIVMEMTRSQQMTFYLLAAALIASFTSKQFSPTPFYHAAARFFRREAVQVARPPKVAGQPS